MSTGYVDDTSVYGSAYSSLMEQVPELDPMLAPYVYARMRRDPQLQAVLQACTLPITRASAAVDPAGCRDEVARAVADDLGLPLLGEDDPGPARRRGVMWPQHIGSATRTRNVYGYAPYALEAQDDGSRTRLVGLYERLPHTIREIQTDPASGELIRARQDRTAQIDTTSSTRTRQPQGPPPWLNRDALAWYVRDREGSNWRGVSLLRAAYGPWLLKHEMWRVHAIGNRRHGAGHLNLEALPGTNPTPLQMQQAAAMAAAARAGDQAGGASPPGFRWRLSGLEGSVPDTLGFITYLDQQMSRMALAGMLDLGNTPNGSRALGSEFVDLFMLALQGDADDIANTTTADAAVRIVDWNWGEDEPAPRVVIGDVGADHAVTAEALQLLLDSGALQPDAELDAYVRRGWRLPARVDQGKVATPIFKYDLDAGTATVNDRRAQLGLDPTPGGDVPAALYLENLGLSPADAQAQAPAVMAALTAAGRKHAREVKVAAKAANGLRRQPTAVEARAATDFVAVQQDWQMALDLLLDDWEDITAAQREQVVAQVRTAVEDGTTVDLAAMAVDTAAAADLLHTHMADVADDSAARMAGEARSQGVTAPTGEPDDDRLHDLATTVAALMGGGLVASAARKALQVWTPDATADQVAGAVETHLASLTDASLRDNLGPALTTAQNEGRLSTLANAPAATYVSSEILDANTCTTCAAEDGTEYGSLGEASAAYANGGYVDCEGRARCRGIIVAVWGD